MSYLYGGGEGDAKDGAQVCDTGDEVDGEAIYWDCVV